jgi:hypothetical protein
MMTYVFINMGMVKMYFHSKVVSTTIIFRATFIDRYVDK